MPLSILALKRKGFAAALAALIAAAGAAGATAVPPDTRPYDDKLMRLSEILGAIHYLRELCGANEGQAWRAHMQALIESEATSPLRKARLTRSFNQGYRSYSRTYNTCGPSAQTAVKRFLAEGNEIADALIKSAP